MNYVKLGEICNIATGKYDANHGENGGDYPFYTCAIKPIKCPTYSFDGESIILPGNGANVGEVLYYNGKFEAYQRTYVLNNFQINSRFVYYQLKNKWKKYICNKQYGSATNYIRYNNLADFKIASLTEKEQQRIVNILDKADEIRTKKKLANEKLDEFLKSTFIDMFGDPVLNTKNYIQKKVIDVCDCMVPARDKPKSFSGDIPWITIEDLIVNGVTQKSRKDIGLTIAEIEEVKRKCIPAGSVIMSCVGNLGICSIAGKPMVINQQLHSFQCMGQINNIFLMYYLGFRQDYMKKHASNTTVLYMNKTVCNSIPVIIPPIDLQKQFAQIVQKVEAQKEKNQQVIEQMDNLFSSLMQQAFKEAV